MTHHFYYAALATTGISSWLKSNAVPLIILIVGLAITSKGLRGEHRVAMRMVGPVVIGLAVFGLAAGGWQTASTDLVHMVGL